MIDGFVALYLFMLAGIVGYVLMARVPSILHTPLMSGSNFIHGVVLAGAMLALGHAEGVLQTLVGFLSVCAASANAVGGYVVTHRMLSLFVTREDSTSGMVNTSSLTQNPDTKPGSGSANANDVTDTASRDNSAGRTADK